MSSILTDASMLTVRQKAFQKAKTNSKEEYCRYLLDHPCLDCGETDIIVLEPDHLRDKKYNISRMISSGYPWASVLKELEKCEIVCRNCHVRREHVRQDGFKVKFMQALLAE